MVIYLTITVLLYYSCSFRKLYNVFHPVCPNVLKQCYYWVANLSEPKRISLATCVSYLSSIPTLKTPSKSLAISFGIVNCLCPPLHAVVPSLDPYITVESCNDIGVGGRNHSTQLNNANEVPTSIASFFKHSFSFSFSEHHCSTGQ